MLTLQFTKLWIANRNYQPANAIVYALSALLAVAAKAASLNDSE